MRNLAIKRKKSFVASLAKMKVYIEDASSNDVIINKVSCRKLGELKNGEEKSFTIDENGAKVFVIADKLSKNYCNEFYNIPAGTEDVYLSGKNCFNLANGNAFRFEGVTDAEILRNRKKGTKKGLIILLVAFIVGSGSGKLVTSLLLSDVMVESEVFSFDEMKITLTNEFAETDVDGYTVCYVSEKVLVLALKESYELVDGFENYTLEEYGNLVITNNNLESKCQLQSDDGLTYFKYQYTDSEKNTTYDYFSVVYKGTDAFWMMQFVTDEEDTADYQQHLAEWAKSVELTN